MTSPADVKVEYHRPPRPGDVVHIGPKHRVGWVMITKEVDLGTSGAVAVEVYVRIMVPMQERTPGLTWGGMMQVESTDLEGWTDWQQAGICWHWPEEACYGLS